MMDIKTNIRPEEVLHQSQHVSFVEGKDRNAVGPKVLNELFENGLRIEPLGPSFYIKSFAEALYQHHPTYYFLIDRDHYDDEFIKNCWVSFPNPDKHNLLIWKKREIENYFIDPEYLSNSKYCKVSKDDLEDRVLEFSKKRLSHKGLILVQKTCLKFQVR